VSFFKGDSYSSKLTVPVVLAQLQRVCGTWAARSINFIPLPLSRWNSETNTASSTTKLEGFETAPSIAGDGHRYSFLN
jgi:hypothetical protein